MMIDLEMRSLTNNPLHRRGGEGAERSEAGEAGTHDYTAPYPLIPHLTLTLSSPEGGEGKFANVVEVYP